MKRASIKDIARLANVSHSTVSRALSGSPLISPETVSRIRQIALESGYRPSAAARSLVTSRTSTIGVVVTSIADPFAAEVVLGIEDAANERDYSVLLANSNALPERELKVVHAFEERRVDGIIVTSSRVGAVYAEVLSQARVPIVLLNNQHPSEFMHSVMIDNFAASFAATRHLIDLGHKRIAYIGDRFGCQSDTERCGGYRAALEQAGLPFRPEFLVPGNGGPDGGATAMGSLLALPNLPTAVFCYNDMTAFGAMGAASARGLGIPSDLSIVGFDDLFFAQFSAPPLTTVRQPMRDMGRLAVENLLKLLAGDSAVPNANVPGELIVRHSTAPPKETN
ncbi:LacI family DNA-binding transcriptional regulator [uncultured Paludibaculum sp.]|uniref:LacI family DNA-binding transcriptional regulator n=1 Tax=uncultured Paludibaculum sp. TaxID=1765020 RepID=UPI002AAB8110|nr:LacI family DNA-binding transcriptional regulator [uncultured Paludibaculum sp.]